MMIECSRSQTLAQYGLSYVSHCTDRAQASARGGRSGARRRRAAKPHLFDLDLGSG